MKVINSAVLLIGAIVLVVACCVVACLRVPARGIASGVGREDAATMVAGASNSSSSLGKPFEKSSCPVDKTEDGRGVLSKTEAKEMGYKALFFRLILLFVLVVALSRLKFLPPTFVVLGDGVSTVTSVANTCAHKPPDECLRARVREHGQAQVSR